VANHGDDVIGVLYAKGASKEAITSPFASQDQDMTDLPRLDKNQHKLNNQKKEHKLNNQNKATVHNINATNQSSRREIQKR
jgi:hypothetical protein